MDTPTALTALAALAHESRLAVFRLLVQAGPSGMAASKIAEQLAIAPSSLSFHLKELTHAGLLASKHQGRFVIYCTNIEVMNGVIAYLTENCCAGVPCSLEPFASCTPPSPHSPGHDTLCSSLS